MSADSGETVAVLDDLARLVARDGDPCAWVEVSWAACRVSSGALAPDAALAELADSEELPPVVRDLLCAGQSGLAGRIDALRQADVDGDHLDRLPLGGGRP